MPFYYVNTLFLALTSLMVVLLLNLDKSLRFSETEKLLLVLLRAGAAWVDAVYCSLL